MGKKTVWAVTGLISVLFFLGLIKFTGILDSSQSRNHDPDVKIDLTKQYKIKVWEISNPNMYIDKDEQHKFWSKVISDFEKEYENVKITYTLMEESTFNRRVEKAAKQNKMADVVIDWNGTPFLDKESQFPLENYIDFNESFLTGAVDYVKSHDGSVLAYPIIAKGEYLVVNNNYIGEEEEISKGGWDFQKFEETLKGISSEKQMHVMDYQGFFTSSMLTQANITAVEADGKLNWYDQGFIKIYQDIDKWREKGIVAYSDNWLKNFWHDKVAILGGVDSWVYLKTLERNKKLSNNEIKSPGSNHKIDCILLPYPQIDLAKPRYGMEVVSAIPFVDSDYKGDDHSKLVVEFIQFMSGYFVDFYTTNSCYVPVDTRMHGHWKEVSPLDKISIHSAIKTIEYGMPIRSRFFKDLEEESKVIESIQPLLDEYWKEGSSIEKLIEGIQKGG
ncbi:hypothetical protein PRVXT_001886 [Proteinivorax tanatarense]|uniref:Uncharacterized protein n=1 Tax=Proteinivorax tanatarense TaxID=1260629 RepID=A0AAU7VIL6_9FIRM